MSLGHCVLHPETEGIALCRRCGDSVCGPCGFVPKESLCLGCEARALDSLEKRLRSRLWLWANVWMLLCPVATGAFVYFVFSDLANERFFPGAAVVFGAALGAVLSVVFGRQYFVARAGLGPWIEDGRRSFAKLHERFVEAVPEDRGKLGARLETARIRLLAQLKSGAPGIFSFRRGELGPEKHLWNGVCLTLLGSVILVAEIYRDTASLGDLLSSRRGLLGLFFLTWGLGSVLFWSFLRRGKKDSDEA